MFYRHFTLGKVVIRLLGECVSLCRPYILKGGVRRALLGTAVHYHYGPADNRVFKKKLPILTTTITAFMRMLSLAFNLRTITMYWTIQIMNIFHMKVTP